MPIKGYNPRYNVNRPNKLPPFYIERTLSRFMPTADVIATLSRDELLMLAHRRDTLKEQIKKDPARFWIPNPGGQNDFATIDDPTVRVFLYLAGNKSGKTTAGVIRLLERAWGKPLWGRTFRKLNYRVPCRVVCFAEDFDSHRETTLPTISTWMPQGAILREGKNPQGNVTEMTLDNGSIILFKTYDQGSDRAEGKDWDAVWFDEPPPRDIYTAAFRGIVVSNGFLLCTATLLKETWLYDELVHPFVRSFEGEIHDNLWLSKAAKDDFLSSLSEEERVARERGKPVSLTGRIYKEFRDDEPYVIPMHDVPSDYPIIMGVDPHERRPVHVEYAYITPDDDIIWFECATPPYTNEQEIFASLAEIETKFPSEPVVCIMDPNRGSAIQLGGRSWQEAFEEHGYEVVLGEDDHTSGHTAVHNYLKYTQTDPPKMQWMENLRIRKGPIWQMVRYAWEDDKLRKRVGKNPVEKPKDSNKDFPDIHRYVAKFQPSFQALVQGHPTLDRTPIGWRERQIDKRIRAYG